MTNPWAEQAGGVAVLTPELKFVVNVRAAADASATHLCQDGSLAHALSGHDEVH